MDWQFRQNIFLMEFLTEYCTIDCFFDKMSSVKVSVVCLLLESKKIFWWQILTSSVTILLELSQNFCHDLCQYFQKFAQDIQISLVDPKLNFCALMCEEYVESIRIRHKVLMITNINAIYTWVCWSNKLNTTFVLHWNCLTNLT